MLIDITNHQINKTQGTNEAYQQLNNKNKKKKRNLAISESKEARHGSTGTCIFQTTRNNRNTELEIPQSDSVRVELKP